VFLLLNESQMVCSLQRQKPKGPWQPESMPELRRYQLYCL
jgi:hypothetical protein